MAAAAVGAGMWAIPSANAGGGDHRHGDSDVFRVSVREVDSAELDLGETGFGLGDRFVFSEDLYKRGKRVGSDHGECVLTRMQGQDGTFQCNVTAVFRKGQLTIQGAFSFSEEEEQQPFVLAVTGGTGAFKGASGVVVVDETGDTSTLTFKLKD